MADLGAIGYGLETPDSMAGSPSISLNTGGKLGIGTTAGLKADGSTYATSDGLQITSVPQPAGRTAVVPPTTYKVSGNLKEGATNKQGWRVRAYRRDTGEYIGTALSDASGNWLIYVYAYNGEVTCVAYDDTVASPDYNAIVYDRVTPVAA